jgi:hypothetical protein
MLARAMRATAAILLGWKMAMGCPEIWDMEQASME